MMERPILFHTLALLVVATAVGFVGAIVCQQMLRRGADQPQKQMVNNYAARLARGADLEQIIPNYRVDVANSLEPFVAFYDDGGKPVRSTGYLESFPLFRHPASSRTYGFTARMPLLGNRAREFVLQPWRAGLKARAQVF